MAINRGKQFEAKFEQDFSQIDGASVDRIYDTVTGYKSISNICDFICYVYPNIFYIECKSVKGNTLPFVNLTQYEKMKNKVGIRGVRVGVVIWFYDHNRVIYVPISSIEKMKNDQKKSVNIRLIDRETYDFVEIPSKLKRVFMDSDYSSLLYLNERM